MHVPVRVALAYRGFRLRLQIETLLPPHIGERVRPDLGPAAVESSAGLRVDSLVQHNADYGSPCRSVPPAPATRRLIVSASLTARAEHPPCGPDPAARRRPPVRTRTGGSGTATPRTPPRFLHGPAKALPRRSVVVIDARPVGAAAHRLWPASLGHVRTHGHYHMITDQSSCSPTFYRRSPRSRRH